MTNKEVLSIIKEINTLVDRQAAGEDVSSFLIPGYLDMITVECDRYKFYHAWSVHHSRRTGHYWVTFTQ